MKQLTIYSIGTFYQANKIEFVKLLKESTNLNLKEAKDLADEIFSKFSNNSNGDPFRVKLESINTVYFFKNVSKTLTYEIMDVKEDITVKEVVPETDNFAVALDTIRKGLYESHKLRQEIDQLKQINHELTKEVRSLKSTLYKTAVDLNKQYQATNELINCSGPRAAHIIKDLANDIRENGDTSEATKDC